MSLSTGNYAKLKTSLRLAINRLKLVEKKKAELARKAQREIGEYLAAGKLERAKIRVEHIIREDFLVEAMELVEMYCDTLLARFGLIQQMKTMDDALQESISSLVWVAPRLQADIPELKTISELLGAKYGKQFVHACRENGTNSVNEKLIEKMSPNAPKKALVEKYLIEIAKVCNVPYEPDEEALNPPPVALAEEAYHANKLLAEDSDLIDLATGGPPPAGPVGYPTMPTPYPPASSMPAQPGFAPSIPVQPPIGFNVARQQVSMQPGDVSTSAQASGSVSSPVGGMNDFTFPEDKVLPNPNQPPTEGMPSLPPSYDTVMANNNAAIGGIGAGPVGEDSFPELPSVPSAMDSPSKTPKPDNEGQEKGGDGSSSTDLEDLSRRFEELKRKK